MIHQNVDVRGMLQYDWDQAEITATALSFIAKYAEEESKKAVQRYLDAEKRLGGNHVQTIALLHEACNYHKAAVAVHGQFSERLVDFETAGLTYKQYIEDFTM